MTSDKAYPDGDPRAKSLERLLKIKTRILASAVMICLIGTTALRADDLTVPAAAAPALTALAANPTPKKHHHKHKKAAVVPVTSNNSTITSASAQTPQVGASAGSLEMPGLNQNRGAGSVGGPNWGSGDHTQGTSGTSGQ